jgi:hypothetical protein
MAPNVVLEKYMEDTYGVGWQHHLHANAAREGFHAGWDAYIKIQEQIFKFNELNDGQ